MVRKKVTDRAMGWRKYVAATGQGSLASRQDYATEFGVSYSCATYHLEIAVQKGKLNKQYGMVGEHQAGWLYGLPETLPRLKGLE